MGTKEVRRRFSGSRGDVREDVGRSRILCVEGSRVSGRVDTPTGDP